ncbi:MAG: hypothetical protein VX550_01895 [Bacteroidota bacterium]|nr:hypothetical protein [Bacteroidota bacterium]
MAEDDQIPVDVNVSLDDSKQQENYHSTTFNLLANVVDELVESRETAEDIEKRDIAREKKIRALNNAFRVALFIRNKKLEVQAEKIALEKEEAANQLTQENLGIQSSIESGIYALGDILQGNDLAKAENERENRKLFEKIADKETEVNIEAPNDKKGILSFLGMFGLTAFATALGAALGTLAVFPGLIIGFTTQIGKTFKALFPKSSKAITGIFTKVSTFFKGIGASVAERFNNIKKSISGFFGKGSKAGKVLDSVKKFFSGFGKTIEKFMKPVRGFIKGFTKSSKLFLKIGATLGRIAGRFLLPVTIIMGVIDGVKGFIQGFKESDGESMLAKIVDGLYGALANIVGNLIGVPLDLLKSGVGFILGFFGMDNAKEALDSFSFKDLIMDIITGIGDFMSGVVDFVVKLFTNPKEALSGLADKMKNFGKIVSKFIKMVLKNLLPRYDDTQGMFSIKNAAVKLIPEAVYNFAGIDKGTGLDLPEPVEIATPTNTTGEQMTAAEFTAPPNTTGADITEAETEKQESTITSANKMASAIMTMKTENVGGDNTTVVTNIHDNNLPDKTMAFSRSRGRGRR